MINCFVFVKPFYRYRTGIGIFLTKTCLSLFVSKIRYRIYVRTYVFLSCLVSKIAGSRNNEVKYATYTISPYYYVPVWWYLEIQINIYFSTILVLTYGIFLLMIYLYVVVLIEVCRNRFAHSEEHVRLY